MNTLCIWYLSLLDPLTQTQVVPYLEGLVQAGYRVILLTFEPRALTAAQRHLWQRRLAAKGIIWHWCRYHKRPTLPATAWDITAGVFAGLRIIHRHKVRLVHARGYVPGVMALILKRLTGAKLLFDMEGFMAEEYVDAGMWPPGGMLFRLTKRAERATLKAADGIVILTQKAKELLLRWYPQEISTKPIVIKPCCVDMRHRPTKESPRPRPAAEGGKTMVYVGKLDGWYLTDVMADFMATAIRMVPGLRCQVWTQSDPRRLRELLQKKGINGRVTVGSISAEALPAQLIHADAGLSFIKPCLSKLASSPTKVGEYLAAGLPVITNPGIGGMDALLARQEAINHAPVGVMVREFAEEAYQKAIRQWLDICDDPSTPRQCREVAEQHLDLQRVGWARYRQIYHTLIGKPEVVE